VYTIGVIKRLWIIALFFTLPCFGQDTGVFAPFVTQLEAEIRNNLIRLSWKDSGDTQGPVYIYRSETPISNISSLPSPVEIPYGVQSYLDEAEKPGNLHYYVVASDQEGQKYTISLPYTNKVSVNVSPENVGVFASAPSSPRSGLPGIEGLKAQVDGDRVILTFSGVDSARNPILYRSIVPIRRPEDLLSALIIRQRVGSPYIDHPLPGITYYYAIIYEEEFTTGIIGLRQGSNVTGAVEIAVSRPYNSRDIPLPGLSLSPTPETVPVPGDLSPEAARVEAAIQRMSGRNRTQAEAQIFAEDLKAGGAGEEYQFRSIVQDYFNRRNWKGAEEEFRRFLELPRSKRNRAKAQFYLGQAYYFQEKSQEALYSFMEAREMFPTETNFWIQTVLGDISR